MEILGKNDGQTAHSQVKVGGDLRNGQPTSLYLVFVLRDTFGMVSLDQNQHHFRE